MAIGFTGEFLGRYQVIAITSKVRIAY